MTRDLRTGVPNSFGADKVFVMGVREGAVDLGIVRAGVEEPPAWISTGETIYLDGHVWTLREIMIPQENPDTRMPGARTGRTVARIEPA